MWAWPTAETLCAVRAAGADMTAARAWRGGGRVLVHVVRSKAAFQGAEDFVAPGIRSGQAGP